MCWTLAGGYQHAFSHDETQPHEIFTGLCEFLMQIRHHGAISRPRISRRQCRAGPARNSRARSEIGARSAIQLRPRVGQPEVQPDPAGAVAWLHFVLRNRLGSAIGSETVRPDNASGWGGIGQIAGVLGVSSLADPSASGTGAHDNTMTALLRSLLRGVDEAAGLTPPQRGVVPVTAQQFVMRTLFHDAAVIEHHKPVHLRNGR